jgi:hypothetical protein
VAGQILGGVLALAVGVVGRRAHNPRTMLAGVEVMRVDILHLHRNRVAARSGSVWNGPPVLRIGVGQNDCPVSECDTSAMPADPPQLDIAERLTQPVDGVTDIGINQFRGDAS